MKNNKWTLSKNRGFYFIERPFLSKIFNLMHALVMRDQFRRMTRDAIFKTPVIGSGTEEKEKLEDT